MADQGKGITVDNYPIDVSIRYAQTKEELDPSFIESLKTFPTPSERIITETAPYYSELSKLWDIGKRNISWAQFTPPKNFFAFTKPLFTHRIIPSIGDISTFDQIKVKVESVIDEETKKEKEGKISNEDLDEINTEKLHIFQLLDTMKQLERDIHYMRGKMGEFRRG